MRAFPAFSWSKWVCWSHSWDESNNCWCPGVSCAMHRFEMRCIEERTKKKKVYNQDPEAGDNVTGNIRVFCQCCPFRKGGAIIWYCDSCRLRCLTNGDFSVGRDAKCAEVQVFVAKMLMQVEWSPPRALVDWDPNGNQGPTVPKPVKHPNSRHAYLWPKCHFPHLIIFNFFKNKVVSIFSFLK